MKKLILSLALILSSAMYKVADAQVNIRVNIGSQPVWGPVGYDYVDHYYFPEEDIYYNVSQRQFIYLEGPRWVSAFNLPSRYRNFDMYRSYKVVVNEPEPYRRHDFYRAKYGSYRGRPQQIIYNSRDPRYFVIDRHPEHSSWMRNNRSNDYGRRYNHGWDRNDNRGNGKGYNRSDRSDDYRNRRGR